MSDLTPDRAQMLLEIDATFHRVQATTGLEAPDPRVRAVMSELPREAFLPVEQRAEAYADVAVTIACGQTISQPFVVALMTSLLQLRGYERVLEIGTGSGYQAAVLARLCRRVHTIERWPQLARSAAAQLAAQKIDNVEWRCGDGSLGWPEAAPFDGILVTCAATAVPPPLLGQLSHGGCLVAPIGEPWEVQQLTLVRRDETGTLHHRAVLPVRFVPLVAGVPPASGLRSGR